MAHSLVHSKQRKRNFFTPEYFFWDTLGICNKTQPKLSIYIYFAHFDVFYCENYTYCIPKKVHVKFFTFHYHLRQSIILKIAY